MRAVADAGPIIHLSWIDLLEVLPRLFEEVTIPSAVQEEVMIAQPGTPGIEAIRTAMREQWLQVRPVEDVAAVGRIRTAGLDRGEAETIVLFGQLGANILLLDDRRARLYAEREGLAITGTIGILRLARTRGLIPAVSPLVDRLRSYGFRISTALAQRIHDEDD